MTGLDAQRKIVEGMRKKVETMKTLMTPAHSNNQGNSIFNFPSTGSMNRSAANSIVSLSSINANDDVFRGLMKILVLTIIIFVA